eukprot:403339248
MKLILEKLKIKDQTKGKPKRQQSKSIEDSSKKLKKLPTMVKQDAIVSSDSSSNKADQAITKIEQKLNVDDWGKNIKLIYTSDSKPVPVQYDPTVWIKYKSGLKQRVRNALLSDESQEYEYTMVFDLGEVIQITEIQIGVVFSWTTYDQDQNYEPLTILVQGGLTQNNYEFKSLMSSIKDYGFESNQVRPYGSIFYPVGNTDQSQTLEDQIGTFGKREARYLKIRFRRIIQTNLDQSSFMNQVAKAKLIGISFLSVMGTHPIKSLLVYQHLIEIQKQNSLELLIASIISASYTDCMKILLESDVLKEKIFNAFSDQKIEMQLAQNTAQIIFNCTQNSLFLDTINKSELIDTVYNFLKIQVHQDSTEKSDYKLLNKNSFNDQTLNLLVDALKQLFIIDTDVQIKYSQILEEDMKLPSQIGDVEFISKVIVPILHSEKLENISISVRDPTTSRVKSFFEIKKIQAKQDTFFLQSSILNSKQQKTLDKVFREITQDIVETAKLVKSKWELIYEDSDVQTKSQPEFLKFVKAVSNKQLIDLRIRLSNPFNEANFVFQYTPDKEHHYTMNNNKPFGYIYTDYQNSGALSKSGDFFLISWSHEFSNTCGNIYDMKCIEDPSVIIMYNNMNIIDIEVFYCDLNRKASPSGGVTQLKELKKHKFYSPLSPSTTRVRTWYSKQVKTCPQKRSVLRYLERKLNSLNLDHRLNKQQFSMIAHLNQRMQLKGTSRLLLII